MKIQCAASVVVLCATTLALAPAARAERTATMGLDEGVPAATQCPGKAYLAGFSVQYDYSMSGLAPYCVEMSADGSWAGGARLVAGAQMSEATLDGKRIDLFCPLDFFLVGFRGWSHVYGIHSIMQITLTCRNPQTGTLWEIATEKGKQSLTEWRGGRCADHAAANGAFGRVSAGKVIQFGLTCALTQPAAREQREIAKLRNGAREAPSTRHVPALTPQSARSAASEQNAATRRPPLSDAASSKTPPAPTAPTAPARPGPSVSKANAAVLNPQPLPPKSAFAAPPVPATEGAKAPRSF